ncbi:hypothetical protein EGJ28_21260 [Stutzerimonas xanthomarina]|jgi:hypothetical protein|uniref:Flagella basal body P-ring formation protein FlgA n=2 Tax=Stutzerimonas TaxID=2901164 RepID=A0AA40RV96_STUST|nr:MULTISPECIES: hypothetical protein [Stutzerimonas]KIL03100.1 hypothetical protein QX25_18030 [Stutzerimonas stutzeri]MBA1306651.1 hypothetical protein [Stutzerimonas stutzeri]MBK3919877.1 hypothetical protein [Stutzerimonas frequens]RRV05469.1 hypothetical protein EGJ28_21260 [Stutzerimonas xanthomarina]
MRWPALLLLTLPIAAHAAPAQLVVSVASGAHETVTYRYPLEAVKQELDLRESARYDVALKDKATGRDVCREAQYKTGLLLTLRPLAANGSGSQSVEVVGQVSELASLTDGAKLSCGTNQEISLAHRAFSDTVVVEQNRSRAIVIDGQHTVILKMQ